MAAPKIAHKSAKISAKGVEAVVPIQSNHKILQGPIKYSSSNLQRHLSRIRSKCEVCTAMLRVRIVIIRRARGTTSTPKGPSTRKRCKWTRK